MFKNFYDFCVILKKMAKRNESAAKSLSFEKYGKRSQTISKESTPNDDGGSGELLTFKDEDEDIVESKSKKFIEKSVKKHNFRFNYDKVKYINSKTKVIIGCLEHGYFEQTPDKHLNSIHCCPMCNILNRNKNNKKTRNKKISITYEDFLKRIAKKYGNIEINLIDEWEGVSKTNIKIFCEKHGFTTNKAKNLLLLKHKYFCDICSNENRIKNRTHDKESIIKKLNILFNNKYTFIFPENFKNKHDIIDIICPVHGIFKRKVSKLLSGQYCSKCRIENLVKNDILVGGYNQMLFNKKPELKNVNSLLYFLKINNGENYKIGITRNFNTKNRIRSLKNKSRGEIKNIEEIKIKKMTLYDAFCIEQKILKKFKHFRVFRKWSTELFRKDITEHILHYFT